MKYFQSRDQLDPSSKELDGEVVHEAVPLSYLGTSAGSLYTPVLALTYTFLQI